MNGLSIDGALPANVVNGERSCHSRARRNDESSHSSLWKGRFRTRPSRNEPRDRRQEAAGAREGAGTSIKESQVGADITSREKTMTRDHVSGLFQDFARTKTRDAESARIEPLSTVLDRCAAWPQTRAIGNAWSAMHYGGDFCLVDQRPDGIALLSRSAYGLVE